MGRMLDVLHCNIKRYKSKTDTVTYGRINRLRLKIVPFSPFPYITVENVSLQCDQQLKIGFYVAICLYYKKSYATTKPIQLVWGDNVGRFL